MMLSSRFEIEAEAIGGSGFLTMPATRTKELTGMAVAHLIICFDTLSPEAAITA